MTSTTTLSFKTLFGTFAFHIKHYLLVGGVHGSVIHHTVSKTRKEYKQNTGTHSGNEATLIQDSTKTMKLNRDSNQNQINAK